MISYEVNNIKTTNKYCCNVCNKEYSRKSSFDKHKILCDFKSKSQVEHEIEYEELGDIPNHLQLVKIVQELTLKYNKMEQQFEKMKKFVDKQKKKINVIQWLNNNIFPTVSFAEWISMYFNLNQSHFESLMEKSLFSTVQQVFEYNFENHNFIYPIQCFSEKNNIFYICDKNDETTCCWRQANLSDIVLLLKTLQNKMICELRKWKTDNQNKFDDNDKISELFNKAVIKLMNISFTSDSTMSRIKNGLYNYLKTDIKMMIEYEFEF